MVLYKQFEVTTLLNTYSVKLKIFKDIFIKWTVFLPIEALEFAVSATALVTRGFFMTTTGMDR
jgi:hypothetical protein